MGKFTGRMNKLFLKTHFFVSNTEFELIRDYVKALLEEEGVSVNDFKNEFKELDRLYKNAKVEDQNRLSKKRQKMFKDNRLFYCAFLYKVAQKDCKRNFYGIWYPNTHLPGIPRLLRDAKDYFRFKKKES